MYGFSGWSRMAILKEDPLYRGGILAHAGHHDIAVFRLQPPVHHQQIPMVDARQDHAFAIDLEQKGFFLIRPMKQAGGEGDVLLDVLHR